MEATLEATHISTFVWRIPQTEEPGWLQSMGSQKSDTTEHLTLGQVWLVAVMLDRTAQ